MSNKSLSQTLIGIIERNQRGETGTKESMDEVDEAIRAAGVGSYQEQQRLR